MQSNPYPEEPIYSQPTERSPQVAPPSYPQQEPPAYTPTPDGGYNTYPPQAGNAPPPNNDPNNNPVIEQRRQRLYRRQRAETTTYGIAKFIDYLKWLLIVLEVIFALRFLLKLLGADPYNPFAAFLYGLSGFFLAPFRGLLHDPSFGTTTVHVFEWTTLIGMLIYALIFWIIWMLLRTTITRPSEPVN